MRSPLRLALAVLVVGMASRVPCQTLPVTPGSPHVPDTVLYRAFFRRVMFLDDVARQMDAKGPNAGATARTSIRRLAGLTDREIEVLKGEAADCTAKVAANDAAAKPLVQAARAAAASGGAPSATTLNRLQDLQNKRDQIVTDHIQELRRSLGDARFLNLDAFIRANSNLKLRPASAPKPGPQR